MESEIVGLIILLACTVGPAVAILIFVVKRQRDRGKFHRQRITKGRTHRHDPED